MNENSKTAPPGITRILLGATASAALTATGAACFAVIGKASFPNDPTRWVVYLMPTSIATADAACRVALGQSQERKSRTSNPSKP